MGNIGFNESIEELQNIINEIKKTSSVNFNEFAYISATNKSESYLRDRLAIVLQRKYPDVIISREYLHKDSLLEDTNERYDIAVLEKNNNSEFQPTLIVELKNWYCHDIPSKKIWNALISDELRVDVLSEKLGRSIDVIHIINFTHITNLKDDLHNGIIKYQSFINDDIKKGKKKYPFDIDKYFDKCIINTDRHYKRLNSELGKYHLREIINYLYVIEKKN